MSALTLFEPGTSPGSTDELDVPDLTMPDPFASEQPKAELTSAQLYANWSKSPTPATAGELLKKLQPSINQSLRKYIGEPDHLSRSQAKRLVLDALPRYDASQSRLETFVDRQIQPIIRWQSRRKNTVKLPDAMRMDAIAIGNASRSIERETGRSASTRQLADETGLPIAKIEQIRKIDRTLLVGSQELGSPDGGESANIEDQAVVDDQRSSQSWLQFVMEDLTPLDQSILEHTLGLNGSDVLSNADLAKRLKLSPGAISQRKARIQMILDREEELSPFR